MRNSGWMIGVLGLAAGMAAGVVVGHFVIPPRKPKAIAQPLEKGTELLPDPEVEAYNPAERELYADLYVQTAAEYQALCLQTYRLAHDSLKRRLAVSADKDARPPAVVIDLDETVLDNSRYQSGCYRAEASFDPRTWAVWEKSHAGEVGLVPGATDFLAKVGAIDKPAVTVFFVSNRRDRAGTLDAMRRLGLDPKGDADKRLLLRESDPDKDSRRKQVEKTHRIVMLVGDSLADFSSDFNPSAQAKSTFAEQKAAVEARQRKVEEHKGRFGEEWIILPNPVYGDWTTPLGDDPSRHLRPTTFRPAR